MSWNSFILQTAISETALTHCLSDHHKHLSHDVCVPEVIEYIDLTVNKRHFILYHLSEDIKRVQDTVLFLCTRIKALGWQLPLHSAKFSASTLL
jgi:hypothetical protein